jgi:hypothetical protein
MDSLRGAETVGRGRETLASLARLTKLEAAPQFELLDSKATGPGFRLRLAEPKARKKIDVHRNRPGDRRAQRIEARAGDGAAEIAASSVFATIARERLNLGDSICVDGVCLTVAALGASSFFADVSGETLRVTTLGAKASARA